MRAEDGDNFNKLFRETKTNDRNCKFLSHAFLIEETMEYIIRVEDTAADASMTDTRKKC